MLKDARTGAFVAVTDRARARTFYGGTLGLPLVHEDDFALVFDSFGTTLRVSPMKTLTPQPFTVLGWEVPDITAAVTTLAAKGIEFLRVPGLKQDDLGIWSPAPGVFVAWFKDPDGNTLSLGQH
jgi:catechol 2,3-dioxygenase-like lactoylglutathione lyase family enzyme